MDIALDRQRAIDEVHRSPRCGVDMVMTTWSIKHPHHPQGDQIGESSSRTAPHMRADLENRMPRERVGSAANDGWEGSSSDLMKITTAR